MIAARAPSAQQPKLLVDDVTTFTTEDLTEEDRALSPRFVGAHQDGIGLGHDPGAGRSTIMQAFNDVGAAEYLRKLARSDPRMFGTLLSKVPTHAGHRRLQQSHPCH